jgi:hypothetical protein
LDAGFLFNAAYPTTIQSPLERRMKFMTPKVSQYVNKTILVSIPSLFEDGACRACKLLGDELQGLWLQSEELTQRLLPDDKQEYVSAAPVVFVPYAQIAGVLVATKAPAQASSEGQGKAADAPGTRAKARPEPSPETNAEGRLKKGSS